VSQPQARSTNSAGDVMLGQTEPRLWTPPLRELTPDTSYGYDVIDFADTVLGEPLDPWEQWAAIHAGELLPDGRPRFRVVLILAARQNGKTQIGRALVGYWMAVEQRPLTLNTSTDRKYAKRFWSNMCDTFRDNPQLSPLLGPGAVRLTIGEEALTTTDRAELIFAANNGRAARSTTLHRWLCDELLEHTAWDTWSAVNNAMNAVPDAQTVVLTNQGDASSVVLDALRGSALGYLETGVGDPRLGLLEWSAPDGIDPTSRAGLAMANPNLGRRIDLDALLGAGARAKAAGGEELTKYRTEVLCQRVHMLDPAIDPTGWSGAGTTTPVNLAQHRDRLALCIDVSIAGDHATLMAAAALDGKVHVEVVQQWVGHGCTKALRRDLPAVVAKIRPRALGWFPTGPAAAVAADLADRGARNWPPRRCRVEEIRGEVSQVCMGLADLVSAGEIVHPDDDMLNAHVAGASKLWRGDTYVYARRGRSPVDGTYALAGAVHLARTLPPPPPPLEVVR
jgi:phage terminase large subunit-like protein